MYEDLLFIIKNLLNQINELNFTEEEEEHITGVIKRIIFILLIELRKQKNLYVLRI